MPSMLDNGDCDTAGVRLNQRDGCSEEKKNGEDNKVRPAHVRL